MINIRIAFPSLAYPSCLWVWNLRRSLFSCIVCKLWF